MEINLPSYEAFDDYLEVVTNFGYLTLFAPALNMSPLVFYIFHYIEMKNDGYKICNFYSRPIPYKTGGLGPWNFIMNIMSIFCVISNIVLFAFSSD